MPNEADLTLSMRRQTLGYNADGWRCWQAEETTVQWPARATALVLCDVWDHHTCPGAEQRLERLLPRMQEVVTALRARDEVISFCRNGISLILSTQSRRYRGRVVDGRTMLHAAVISRRRASAWLEWGCRARSCW